MWHPGELDASITEDSTEEDIEWCGIPPTPYAKGGPTCDCNLAPLCRLDHRLKTHTGWRYRPLDPLIDPGVYHWRDPHGHQYIRGPTGTIEVADPSPLPALGCSARDHT